MWYLMTRLDDHPHCWALLAVARAQVYNRCRSCWFFPTESCTMGPRCPSWFFLPSFLKKANGKVFAGNILAQRNSPNCSPGKLQVIVTPTDLIQDNCHLCKWIKSNVTRFLRRVNRWKKLPMQEIAVKFVSSRQQKMKNFLPWRR